MSVRSRAASSERRSAAFHPMRMMARSSRSRTYPSSVGPGRRPGVESGWGPTMARIASVRAAVFWRRGRAVVGLSAWSRRIPAMTARTWALPAGSRCSGASACGAPRSRRGSGRPWKADGLRRRRPARRRSGWGRFPGRRSESARWRGGPGTGPRSGARTASRPARGPRTTPGSGSSRRRRRRGSSRHEPSRASSRPVASSLSSSANSASSVVARRAGGLLGRVIGRYRAGGSGTRRLPGPREEALQRRQVALLGRRGRRDARPLRLATAASATERESDVGGVRRPAGTVMCPVSRDG
jgi:hypothetical protein